MKLTVFVIRILKVVKSNQEVVFFHFSRLFRLDSWQADFYILFLSKRNRQQWRMKKMNEWNSKNKMKFILHILWLTMMMMMVSKTLFIDVILDKVFSFIMWVEQSSKVACWTLCWILSYNILLTIGIWNWNCVREWERIIWNKTNTHVWQSKYFSIILFNCA